MLFTYVKPCDGTFVMGIDSEEEILRLRENESEKINKSLKKGGRKSKGQLPPAMMSCGRNSLQKITCRLGTSQVRAAVPRQKSQSICRLPRDSRQREELEVEEGSTIRDILDKLAIANTRFKDEAFDVSASLRDYVPLTIEPEED